MDSPEGNFDRFEDTVLPDDGGEPNGYEFGLSPESGHLLEPSTDHSENLLPRNRWRVEIVAGQALDATDRMSHVIQILLDAAAHPRQ